MVWVRQVRELEAELEAEQRRARDLAAENRKLQRLLAEQKQQTEDERRLAAEANEQINQLQARIKTLKRQLEEAVWCQAFISGIVTIDSLYELTNALSNGTIADPYGHLFFQNISPNPLPKMHVARQGFFCFN